MNSYSNVWSSLVPMISSSRGDKKTLFCIRYAFQAAVYAIWRERNRIRHGEKPMPLSIIKKLTDKGVRNRLSLMRRNGGRGMVGALQFWFQTRV